MTKTAKEYLRDRIRQCTCTGTCTRCEYAQGRLHALIEEERQAQRSGGEKEGGS